MFVDRAGSACPHAPRGAQHVSPGAAPALPHSRGGRHKVHYPQAVPEPQAHWLWSSRDRLVSNLLILLIVLLRLPNLFLFFSKYTTIYETVEFNYVV